MAAETPRSDKDGDNIPNVVEGTGDVERGHVHARDECDAWDDARRHDALSECVRDSGH